MDKENRSLNYNNITLRVKGFKVNVESVISGDDADNIIFVMTPIGSVSEAYTKIYYDNLAALGFNVFALDLVGIGQSQGMGVDISYLHMKESARTLVDYIRQNYSTPIHFYGGTGMGGIIGQALVSDPDIGKDICKFAQFGVASYSDLSIMGSNPLYKLLYTVLKMVPSKLLNKKMPFQVPKYSGFNAEKENAWYSEMMKKYPGSFDMKLGLLKTLFGLFYERQSPLRKQVQCPTLVLASSYDRYYYKAYVETYYNKLSIDKKIVWFEDSHLVFHWSTDLLAGHVADWFKKNST